MTKTWNRWIGLAALGFIAGGAADAQTVYKCAGEDGSTVFSQRPCGDDAETVDVAPTNSSAPPSEDAANVFRQRERSRQLDSLEKQSRRSNGTDYICVGARDRHKSAQERWEAVKRDGYTPDQQRYYEQLIRDRKRHADNVCR